MIPPRFAYVHDAPPTYEEHFYVENSYLGSRTVQTYQTNAGATAFYGPTAFFCPGCGSTWARRSPTPAGNCWAVHERPCGACGEGSILTDFEVEHADQFPPEVLRYEFLQKTLHLNGSN